VTYTLGVDLGTTYTAAAVLRDGRAEVATLGTRSLEIPSVVLLREDGVLLIGEPAERRSLTEPGRFAREFKRRIGDPTPILLGGSPFSAHSLMAHLLRGVVKVVADREGGSPDHTVVTCPANWGDYKRELLDQAVTQADIGTVSVATEPEAAAVHYASTTRVAPGDVVAVYDLGGGTFDAAVLRNTGGAFELVGDPRGIEQLGGVYFDEAVFAWVTGHMSEAFSTLDPDDPATVAAVSRLRRECVEAKETLSWDTDTAIPVALPNQRTEIRITRSEFEELIRPALGDTVDAMRRALSSADVEPSELRSVLLVGGSSRIPLVGQMLMAALGRPVAIDVHPKHAVALGAAILSGQQSSAITRAVDSAVTTLVPPTVSRAGRTTVTAPGGEDGDAAQPVPGGAAAGAAALAGTTAAPGPAGPLGGEVLSAAAGPATAMPGPAGSAGGPAGLPGEGAPGAPGAAGAAGVAATIPPPPRLQPGAGAPAGERPGGGRGRGPLVAAAVAVVVALIVGFLVFGSGGGDSDSSDRDEQTGTTASSTPPTAPPGGVDPVVVPQGPPLDDETLAYTQLDPPFWNIWLIDADGSNARALTREQAAFPRLPVLSPDRRSVAYSMESPGALELRVIDTGGEGDRLVMGGLVPDARATWSPDGTRMAVAADRDGPTDIYVIELATGAVTNLTNSPEDEGDPAWSPDGDSIAYWSRNGGNQDIYVVPVDGGEPRRLTSDPGDDGDPSWRPDGSAIAYSSQREGDWDLYVMDTDGGNPAALTDDPSDDQDPSWSSDGTRIAFETKRDTPTAGDQAEIYIMNADGSDQHNVTNRPGLDIHPAWGTPPP
jgi:Tol biopolymer transport system component/actin-like ATPase involved in cell morphogenesis